PAGGSCCPQQLEPPALSRPEYTAHRPEGGDVTDTIKAVINLDIAGPVISRHIYGHFAEHLGDGIHGGIYVGEDSPIPNDQGIRLDAVEALRQIATPNLRWPGGCFADE